MADPASPSSDVGSFTEGAGASTESPVIAFVKQYWYAFVAIGLLVIFLLYSRLHNSAPVGPAQAASAATDANGNVIGNTQDQSGQQGADIVGMMSTQNQAILDALASEATSDKAAAPGTKPKPKPKSKPKPPVHHTAAWNRAHAKELAKLHHKVPPRPVSGAHGGYIGAVGGPPPFGPSVPFGTYGFFYEPLRHSGTMFGRPR